MVGPLPVLRPDIGRDMAKPDSPLCSLQQTAETGNACGLGPRLRSFTWGGAMNKDKYSETISLGELLLTDCSKTERTMLAVLIVDDDRAFRTVLRTLFEEGSGFDNCVEAANAFEALDKSKQLTPNLAIVDFSMPEMNGLQLARQLKAQKPALPIFMLTADYDVNIEKEALSFGITAVFSKLDDLTTLIANARAVCGLE
jgi:two-component system response regulator (stage 0 sporulation protein F)